MEWVGACAALIALVEFPKALEHMHETWDSLFMATILCGLVIGSTSFHWKYGCVPQT
jgi:hypothetical protein